MIIVRAPLRISFVGGGSDFPDFYNKYPGKVISTTINKYVYVMMNFSPLLKGITARYSIIEHVDKIEDLKNDRIREAMKYFKIKESVEIEVISDLPVGIGLGGSSAFTVALVKGFLRYLGKPSPANIVAKIACQIEIDILGEPIGKQDQYASAFGGLNQFIFLKEEIKVSKFYKTYALDRKLLLFYTGVTRKAANILSEQKKNIPNKIETLKGLAELTDSWKDLLYSQQFDSLGLSLNENWKMKKWLTNKISNPQIDKYLEDGIKAGAWGGKLLGAGGGGCLLFICPPNKKEAIKNALGLKEIPFEFTDKGAEVIYGI